MRIVLDIEANGLENPTRIWCIVCKDLDTGEIHVFRHLCTDEAEKERFKTFISSVSLLVGHNVLGYDYPVICNLMGIHIPRVADVTIDTFILSKLVNYSRPGGHSIEQYGEELGYPKIKFNDFSKYSTEMETYCVRDVEICEKVFNSFRHITDIESWLPSIRLENRFQLIVNDLHNNGFGFNTVAAKSLLSSVTKDLEALDREILDTFKPRLRLIREVTPRLTKHGTISKSSIPKKLREQYNNDLSVFVGEAPFSYCELVAFNPSSHKQIIDVLSKAGWKPTDKTKAHIELTRDLNRLKYQNNRSEALDLALSEGYSKLKQYEKYGWKINENNLNSLPLDAPPSARTLANRILLESRRRTLTEWLSVVRLDNSRVHGAFAGIGAWTHRMAHQKPNLANIPREFKEDGSVKLLGKELRQLWIAPKNRLLVGVDAEGIQLRIFAHYINDPEFTDALVRGKKEDKSDPHSLNQRILGHVCKSRQAAKRFIYALLLGAGITKLAEVLDASKNEAQSALDRLMARYTGFTNLKETLIPIDAKRGWFYGIDGRKVPIPGNTFGDRRHLCMSGYLQNGEAIVIKTAAVLTDEILAEEKAKKQWMFVDIVHDELQSETSNNMKIALRVAEIKANAIKTAGELLKLKCPMAGSYWNDDTKDYTIGTNWYRTH